MSASSNSSPGDDPNGQLPDCTVSAPTQNSNTHISQVQNNVSVPKPKRIACIICRRRKLKCDGTKPSCSTCTRLGHDCAYDEVRRKSGPKRGYVKALEERLKEVERQLKTQDASMDAAEPIPKSRASNGNIDSTLNSIAEEHIANGSTVNINGIDLENWGVHGDSPSHPVDNLGFGTNDFAGMGMDDPTFAWEMIGLGLEEPLPPQDTIEELQQIYFEKIHPSMPMIHKYRYLAAMNLAPSHRPPVCLRYAMWTHAASITERYMDLKNHFYLRARKYVELDYMKGHGESIISLAHAQTHILLASYEFKMMYFPRAWMNTGSGIRLSQMMSLHKLDGTGLEVKQTLQAPRDWTEREERRRTFWLAFCQDRYASIGTGWPMSIDERDISTDLPASDEAFDMSKPERTQSLIQAMNPSGASKLSAFGGVILMASLFGRNLIHLHRPDPGERDDDLNGAFWKRHRTMDNILLNTSLSMPSHLKLPNGLSNPNIVFTNMNIHTSTICLHQAAIYKADKNNLPASISAESKVRCITAANEIASVMRMVSHLDLSSMNPFMSFCLYVAARVFVQYLKSRPEDNQTADSLRFLLSAMNALKKKVPLTESFLVQLDVDLESLGSQNETFRNMFACRDDMTRMQYPARSQAEAGCNTLMRIEDEIVQAPGLNVFPDLSQPKDLASVDYSERPQASPNWVGNNTQKNGHLSGVAGVSTMAFGPRGLSANGFNNASGHSDTGRSPETISSGLTPNSTTPSDTQQRGSVSAQQPFGYNVSSSNTQQKQYSTTTTSFFSIDNNFADLQSTGLTPDALGGTTAPESTTFSMQESTWETSGNGMTPLGPGVFRHLMELGIDQMDMGWEGTS